MGKLSRFDPRRRRVKPPVYRYKNGWVPPSQRKRGRVARLAGWLRELWGYRPFMLLGMLIGLVIVGRDPALVESPGFLLAEPEPIASQFTRCGPGRGFYCVIDGDTFKAGDRKFRVVGIDAAEVDARCAQEAVLAESATQAMQDWLNSGPFEMRARIDEPVDQYGRELVIVTRIASDGGEDSLADFMREHGGARRYLGGLRQGWCG